MEAFNHTPLVVIAGSTITAANNLIVKKQTFIVAVTTTVKLKA